MVKIRRGPLWTALILGVSLLLGLANLLIPPYDRLSYAIRTGQTIIVRAALVTGSDPDGCDYPTSTRDGEPYPPLANAVGTGRVDVVRVLLEAGAKPNFLFSDDASPLGIALYLGSDDVIKLLLKYGADPLARTSGGTIVSETLADTKHTNKAQFLVSYLNLSDPAWSRRAAHSVPRSCVYGKT